MDMTREEKLARINRWVKDHQSLDKQINALEAVVGPLLEGPLFEAVWGMFDSYTDAVSMSVGDRQKWLYWYAWENDMGKKGLGASPNADTEPVAVDSTEKLLWAIEGYTE